MEPYYSEALRELAQPYLLKSENNPTKTLVILVHGFGASATETRPLAEFLQKCGYDCKGILLSGHGLNSGELDKIRWKEWITDIYEVYSEYREEYKHVFIGGVSLGGALSLYTTTIAEFDGIFTINAFYDLDKLRKLILPILAIFKIHVPRSNERIQWYLEKGLFSYPDDSVHAANQIRKFHKRLHKKMKEISIPVLIIQSQEDQTVDPDSGQWIYDALQTEKEIMILPKGDHILTVDPNRDPAFDKIKEFIVSRLQKNN